MLSTGDIRDWDAVVDQVLRCLVLKAPMDRRRQLELNTLRDIEPMQFFVQKTGYGIACTRVEPSCSIQHSLEHVSYVLM